MLYIKNPVKFLHSQIFSSIEHWWLTDLRLHLDYFHAFGCQILHYLVSSATFRITVSYLCCFYSSLSFLQMWACTKDLVPNHRITVLNYFSSVQFSHSVVSDSLQPHGLQHARPPCPSPTPGCTQTQVHWVGNAIQPSHLLSSPSHPTFSLSQHQGLYKGVASLHQVAKVLQFQLQHQSFQWTLRTDLL